MVRHQLVQRIVAAYDEYSRAAPRTIDRRSPTSRRSCARRSLAALRRPGVADGHLSVELVGEERIRELNRDHRGRDEPTDVLSFPIDGAGPHAGPRELGDVVICPEHTDRPDRGRRPRRPAPVRLRPRDRRRRDARAPAHRRACAALRCTQSRAGSSASPGGPNVGKSTLVNAIVGAKVAIISDRPQTTRRASRGVATDVDAGWQMVLVDLPGVQRPRDVLTERMQRRVEQELDGRRRGAVRRQRRAGDRARRPVHRRATCSRPARTRR